MAKIAFTTLSTIALLTLLAEGLAGGLLWSQGRLNSDAIREIRVILQDPGVLAEEQKLAKEKPVVSLEDSCKNDPASRRARKRAGHFQRFDR